MIEVDERFDVPAPPATVWELLADPEAVVGCVPGAAIVAENDDGSLETSLTVKFGPVAVAFQAHAELDLDPEAMQGRLSARGRDKQGGARFQASATFGVAADRAGSTVTTHGEVEISGRLASMIEGGAGVVAKRMSAQFADCLRARCAHDLPGQ
ncbi:MAG: SRPBCC family protein [Chloroflexi bacterium]|nr:SRPBCC family protein [Chloroflexota bacterium]